MNDQATLTVDISSYWHHGTGKAAGPYADAIAERDQDNLPFVAGRMLKGLLRDAMLRCAKWGVLELQTSPENSEKYVQQLFGTRDEKTLSDTAVQTGKRFQTQPGLLHFTDARLPEHLCNYLGQQTEQCANMRQALFSTHYSTAIDTASGVAKPHSLRALEITVPLLLVATIEYLPTPLSQHNVDLQNKWKDLLKQAFPLVRAVGTQRNRGFGRCKLTWANEQVHT